jgi:hypothetical protein
MWFADITIQGVEMKDKMKWFLPFAVVVVSATLAHAAKAPQAGTIVSETSVNCGSKEAHKKSLALVCQEYVVRATSTDYHVRQPKPGNQTIIPINAKVEFNINKDKMKFKVDGKSYEYVVVSEAASGSAS